MQSVSPWSTSTFPMRFAAAVAAFGMVLRQSPNVGGFTLGDVVRLNYYTTDVDGLLGVWNVIGERLGEAGCRPASTLLGVARLAFPELLIEIEATALVP